MTKAKNVLKFKRRREQKTNYKKRLGLLKSKKTRLVVRLSNKYVLAQLVNYLRDGDETIASANAKELAKFGFPGNKNMPSCYLTGYLIGKRGLQNGVNNAILDIGLQSPVKKGRVFAVLQGAIDAGLNVAHSKEALPLEDRIKGKHIEEFASKLSEEEMKKRFSDYFKKNIDPRKLSELVEKARAEIDKGFSEKTSEAKGEE